MVSPAALATPRASPKVAPVTAPSPTPTSAPTALIPGSRGAGPVSCASSRLLGMPSRVQVRRARASGPHRGARVHCRASCLRGARASHRVSAGSQRERASPMLSRLACAGVGGAAAGFTNCARAAASMRLPEGLAGRGPVQYAFLPSPASFARWAAMAAGRLPSLPLLSLSLSPAQDTQSPVHRAQLLPGTHSMQGRQSQASVQNSGQPLGQVEKP